MKKISSLLFILLIIGTTALAQDSTTTADPRQWQFSIDASLLANQNAYSDNWSGGEAGSVIWSFNSNMLATKKLSSKVTNKNTLKLSFGQTHNQHTLSKEWDAPVKSTDLIDLESVFRLTLGVWVDPFIAGRLESQFLDHRVPANERNFNPLKFTESAGAAKSLWKAEKSEWSIRLGYAMRQFVDQSVLDTLTLEKETQTSYDGGVEFVSEFNSPLANKRINYTSRLTVYRALFYSESDELAGLPNEDYWKEPDVNWENIFSANITKYIIVNLYMQLVYDKEVKLGGQFKQTLSLGLTYKLI